MPTDPQDGNLITQLDGLVNVVSDQDDCLAQVTLESEKELMQLTANHWIHSRKWLIHEQDQRISRQSPSHANPLLLPAGQLRRIAVCQLALQTNTGQ